MRDFNEIINEITLTSLTEKTVSKNKLRVDKPTVFITITDSDTKLVDSLNSSGFLLSNCSGISAPTGVLKIKEARTVGKKYLYDLKSEMADAEGRKIRVIMSPPKVKEDSKEFYIYDMSKYLDLLKDLSKKYTNEIILSQFLFEKIEKTYKELKTKNPNVSHELLFLMKTNHELLNQVFNNIYRLMSKGLDTMRIYDNYALASNSNNIIVPIMARDDGQNIFLRTNLRKFEKYLVNKEVADDITKEEKTNKQELSSTKIEAEIDEDGNVNIEVDRKELSRILKQYDIDDPDVVANVKASLNDYIKNTDTKPSKEEAELVILKAINYTVHGKEEIDEEYLVNPEKLINKLSERRTHKTNLEIPTYENSAVNPKDIVDLDYTTGVWRQKYEFEESIHENVRKLFKTIEPTIKVKNIDHEVVDDDQNRLIKYNIELQNTTGGKKEPYNVEFIVPGIVNDRYFKLNGTSYIMGNQHLLKPITKAAKNDVRILSNYAITRLSLENVKFNPSKIEQVLDYIQLRYPILINKITDEYVEFSGDNSRLYLVGDNVYVSQTKTIKQNVDTGKIVDGNGEEMGEGRYELQYEILLNKIQSINPDDRLSKSKKSIPYVRIYMSGVKAPFIIYLWKIKGLLTSLNDLGIDYEIIDSPDKNAKYVLKKDDGKFLALNPDNLRKEYICNGLLVNKINQRFKSFDDTNEISPYIDKTFGSKATYHFENVTKNQIDPITKELLEFEDLPTNLPNLLSTHCLDMLFNQKSDNLSDLKIYRTRLSEMILNIMYSQLTMALSKYSDKLDYGDENAKFEFQKDYVINNISMTPGVLQETKPVNPVQEIELASRTFKTGPGGVPSGTNSFKAEHRNIHPSQIGTMSAVTTPEDTKVGLTVSHTLTPAIMNDYGSYGYKDPDGLSGWNTVSLNEALIPFQNQVDSDRLIMACRHSGQITPTDGNQVPYVGTGAEFIVSQLASSRFTQIAKEDGEVIDIKKGKTLTVQYKSGKKEVFDIMPRNSRTKMGGNIMLEMDSLNVGEEFKKNQVLTHTKNFSKDGIYSSGKNAFVAVMNYDGFSHADAYCISNKMASSMTRDIVREAAVVIPPDVNVLKLEKDRKEVNKNDVLVEFSYQNDLDEYLELNDLNQDMEDEELISTFQEGENSLKLLAQEGEIIDIKIFINNKGSIDKKIVNFHKELATEANEIRNSLESTKDTSDDKIKAIDNMDLKFLTTGNHKLRGGKEFKGAYIVYYIRQKIELTEGDKLGGRFGNKGTISKVLTDKMTPKSEDGNEIEMFISPFVVFSRKSIAGIKEIYLGKVMYFLNKKLQEMSENQGIKTEKIISLITDIYDTLGIEEVRESVKETMKKSPQTIRKKIREKTLNFYFTVPPFKDVSFESIKTAADHLNIPLDEKVYLPEFDTWTKEAVPVGITYIQAMEQTSEFYSNMRSMGKYAGLTRQAVKGKTAEGGQSFGQLDLNAMLTLNSNNIIDELTTLRSDEHFSKRSVINSIVNNSKANMPEKIKKGETQNMMEIYMKTMGLNLH